MSDLINKILTTRILLIFFFLGNQSLFPQERDGFSIIADEDGLSMEPLDVVETLNGDFLIIANELNKTKSKIIKLNAEGNPIGEIHITLADTSLRLTNVFISEKDLYGNSNFVILGTCCPVSEGGAAIVTFIVEDDMSIRYRRIEPLSFTERKPFLVSFLPFKDGFVSCLSFNDSKPFLVNLSPEGMISNYRECDLDSLQFVSNLFAIHNDPNRFGMFAQTTPFSDARAGVLVFDSAFALEKRAYFSPLTSACANGNILHSYLDASQSIMMPLPNGDYVISSKLREMVLKPNGSMAQQDQSVLLIKTDDNFSMGNDSVIIEHFNDTIEIPAPYRSVVSTGDGHVFQCSMGNVRYPDPQFYRDLHLILSKTDEDLNLIWKRRFLRDDNAYCAFSVCSTIDGGCLVVGTMFDFNPCQRLDIFVLKINADGTVGTDETLVQDIRPYAFWPNPVKDRLGLQFSPDVTPAQIELYDLQGRLLKTQRNSLQSIDMEGLPAGTYTMRVTMEDGKAFSDKVVKE